MKGTLIERGDGRWLVRVYTGQRTAKGHPVQISKTVHGGRRKAENELADLISKVTKRRLEDQGVGVTVERLLDRWIEHIRGERTLYTVQGYERKIDARIKPIFGSVRLDRLNASQIDRATQAWLDEGLAPATVRQLFSILAAALQQAYRWGWIDENPARRARRPSAPRRPSGVPSGDELRALIVAAEAFTDQLVVVTAITLAALTGCRRGELCALRWSHLEMDDVGGTVTVSASLTTIKGLSTSGDTKTHQVRRLALDGFAVTVVRRRMAEQERLAAEAEMILDPDPFLLSRSPRGDEPCGPDGLSHGFERVRAEVGVRYRFHDLRHWAATVMISEGVDIRTVAGRLGHSTPSLTLSTYAHVVEARDVAAAKVLSDQLRLPKPKRALKAGAKR